MILDEKIHDWPDCDFLVAFDSSGFPLDKAIAYAKLRKPFMVNNLQCQKILLDRRLVLDLLDQINVPSPRRMEYNQSYKTELNRVLDQNQLENEKVSSMSSVYNEDLLKAISLNLNKPWSPILKHQPLIQIDDNTIMIGSQRLLKPFVEKPVDGEDHNVWVYYHSDQGGGCRKLFRKVFLNTLYDQ